MPQLTNVVGTFPTVVIPHATNGLPVEVSLIAQLGHGAGSHLFHSIAARQKTHAEYRDELEEPSAKIAGTNFDLGDATALYSFIVGPQGHPFHRHAGHRIFTAVSGSGGAQLRFSTATNEELESDPRKFLERLNFINIPPDCMFCVRFGGETWHQFWPLSKNALHPVFFALSCHTDDRANLFANQYPVLDQRVEQDDMRAQVILGAKDKHLIFRSCVSVDLIGQDSAQITLGTSVKCKNAFGHFYMAAISLVHRKYISPTMLRRATDYLISKIT